MATELGVEAAALAEASGAWGTVGTNRLHRGTWRGRSSQKPEMLGLQVLRAWPGLTRLNRTLSDSVLPSQTLLGCPEMHHTRNQKAE